MSTLCPSNLLRATNVAFIIKPVKKKKKRTQASLSKDKYGVGDFGEPG